MWWTKHFRLPSTHEAFLNATLDDLYVEYYEQSFIERPIEAHRRTPDSDIVFEATGDKLIDRWERTIAAGGVPDIDEHETEAVRAAAARVDKAAQRAASGMNALFGDSADADTDHTDGASAFGKAMRQVTHG
jgi:hypothetical protein